MRKLVFGLVALMVAAGCDSPFGAVDGVELRVYNNTDYRFDNVTVNGVGFGSVPSGEYSSFEIVEGAYHYGAVGVDINGKHLALWPIDYVGETPLEPGRYTYFLSADTGSSSLHLLFLEGDDMPPRRAQPDLPRSVISRRTYELSAGANAVDGGVVVAGTRKTLHTINTTISSQPNSRVTYVPDAVVSYQTTLPFMSMLSPSGTRTWVHTYGADDVWLKSVNSVAAVGAEYVLAGEHYWPRTGTRDWEGDAWLIRADASGREVWTARPGRDGQEENALVVRATLDGGLVLGGTSSGSPWLMRMNSTGGTVWERTLAHGFMNRVEQVLPLGDGGLVVVGDKYGSIKQDVGGNVMRTDAAGTVLWTTRFHGSAEAVAPAPNGGFVIAGTQLSGVPQLIALDASGATLWTRQYVGGFGARSIVATPDGGFVVAGGRGFWLLKVDANGNEVWQKMLLPQTSAPGALSLTKMSDGGFLIVGNDTLNGHVIRTTADGAVVWSQTFDTL